MSRVFYAVAREGALPHVLVHINSRTRVPDRVLISLLGGIVAVLTIFYFFQVDLETALFVPSGAAIIIYVIGSAAGVKIFARERTNFLKGAAFALISLVISILVLPFVGLFLVVSLAVVLAALGYLVVFKRG